MLRDNRTEKVQIRFTKEEKEILKLSAKAQGLSLSNFIRLLILKHEEGNN